MSACGFASDFTLTVSVADILGKNLRFEEPTDRL